MSESKPARGEIHRADPAYRRQVLFWLAVSVIASVIGLVAFHLWLSELTGSMGRDNPDLLDHWLRRLLCAMGLVVAVSIAALALWLRRLALTVSAEKRWPPAQLKTSKDIPVRYLGAAEAMAQQFHLSAGVLFVLAAGVATWAVWVGWGSA